MGAMIPAKNVWKFSIGSLVILIFGGLYGWFNKVYGSDFSYWGLGQFYWGLFFIISIMFPPMIYWLIFQNKRKKMGITTITDGCGGTYLILLLFSDLLLICADAVMYALVHEPGQIWRILISLTGLCVMVILGIPFALKAKKERSILNYLSKELKWKNDLKKISNITNISDERVNKIISKFIKRKWIYGTLQENTFKRTFPVNLKENNKDELIAEAIIHEKSGLLHEAFNLYMLLNMNEASISVGKKLIDKALIKGNEEEAVKICGELTKWEKADEKAHELIEKVLAEGNENKAIAMCKLLGDWELASEIREKKYSDVQSREKTISTKEEQDNENNEEEEPECPSCGAPIREEDNKCKFCDLEFKEDTSHEPDQVEDWDFVVDEDNSPDKTSEPHPKSYKEILFRTEGQVAPDSIRKIIPGYQITEKLGSGGFATVYKAEDKKEKMQVAIKLPKFLDGTLDSHVFEKFEFEANMWKKLKHKNIVKIYKSDTEPVPYIAMELMEGGDLKEILKKHRFSIQESMEVMLHISDGMAYAHRMASVHRDIKPENILFTPDGIPKLSDWGIGKFMASEGISKTSGTKGTLKYSAPEQISRKKFGKIDWQTDVFQMGILFYEILTGQTPFMDDEPVGIIAKILHEDVPPPSTLNPDISPRLDKLILKCLSKEKEGRWVSADVLFSQMKRINEQKQINLNKYSRYLKRVLADGIISKDENELLLEIRGELNITLEEHDSLLSEVKGKDNGKEDTTVTTDEEEEVWQL